MCGIYGTSLNFSKEVIAEKLRLMDFRGPDFCGIKEYPSVYEKKISLGHVRLSIIDLDSRSNQPFDYNDTISIVFNGEIYNYKELKRNHLSDVTFKTTSDTEVICAMYERYGSDCVNYFNGMFAYVLFDRKKNILVGARDRLGKKPLYYKHNNSGFEFASQLKAINHCNNLSIDPLARQFYILHGYIPDPYSIFSEVRKLRAGESFVYNISENTISIKSYWNIFDNTCHFDLPKSYEEAKRTVKELLFDSVRLRLEADVPVGMFLSGGIDSSLVSAVVSKLNKNVCAYTIGFDDKKYDESHNALEIAKALDIPIKVNICHGEEQAKIFEDYINFYDEPFCDPSMIPTSLVSQKARQDVKVVLGGDGGDELFFGYSKYLYILERVNQYKKPYWLRKFFAPYFLWKKGYLDMIYSTQRSFSDVYRSEGIFVYNFDGAEKFNRIELAKKLPDNEIFKKDRGILSYSDYDMKFFLNAMNQKVDRASMRSSLELRTPLMDYRLAEYSRLLPFDYLYGKYGLKTILKDILFDIIPQKLLDRPKQGFTPPTATWFKSSLKKSLSDVITFQNIELLFPELDAQKVINLRDRFLKGEKMDARRFWALYTYINWHYKYVR